MSMRKSILIVLFLSSMLLCNAQLLLIYGETNHNIFLGKLNASKYDAESIWNPYGTCGSKYRANSIWNAYDNYRSVYSHLSPLNSYANNPPVIVDYDGNSYGYFTANKYADKRANFLLANIICDYFEEI